jgi:hypothetical protein
MGKKRYWAHDQRAGIVMCKSRVECEGSNAQKVDARSACCRSLRETASKGRKEHFGGILPFRR